MQFRHEGEVFAVYFGQRHKKKQTNVLHVFIFRGKVWQRRRCVCVVGGGGGGGGQAIKRQTDITQNDKTPFGHYSHIFGV